jgi:hypothetical protein
VQEEAVPPALNRPTGQLVQVPLLNEYPPKHEVVVQFEADIDFSGLVVVSVPVGFGQSVQVVAAPPALYLLDGHPTHALLEIICPAGQEVSTHTLFDRVYPVAQVPILHCASELDPVSDVIVRALLAKGHVT